MLLDDEESIIHFLWGYLSILGPFYGIGNTDDDPVVFKGEHGGIG